MKDQVFFGGVPTDPEVKALREAFPESAMVAGDKISYEDVERVIRAKAKSSRFRTVTDRWRAVVERETGRIVIIRRNGTFMVAGNTMKLDMGNSKLSGAVRAARRAYALTGRVDLKSMTPDEKERMASLQRRTGALLAASQIKSTAQLPSLEG